MGQITGPAGLDPSLPPGRNHMVSVPDSLRASGPELHRPQGRILSEPQGSRLVAPTVKKGLSKERFLKKQYTDLDDTLPKTAQITPHIFPF